MIVVNNEQKEEFNRAMNIAYRFAGYRPRSENEMRLRLLKHCISEDIVEPAMDILKKEEVVSDRKFALWWFEERVRQRKKSFMHISAELAEKGVDRDIIKEVSETIDKDQEKTTIGLQIEKMRKKYSGQNSFQMERKMIAGLIRKGFKYEDIEEYLKNSDTGK